MTKENTQKGHANVSQKDSSYEDRSSGQYTKIYTGPERRGQEDRRQQPPQCSVDLSRHDEKLTSVKKYLTVTAIIAAMLLVIQVVVITMVFFVLNQLHDAPNNIINEINEIVEEEQTKHQLYVERIVTDFETRQTTREIAKELEKMKNDVLKAIRNEHENLEE